MPTTEQWIRRALYHVKNDIACGDHRTPEDVYRWLTGYFSHELAEAECQDLEQGEDSESPIL